ncbi:acetoacetate decarboxylase [Saccharothrix saharensis]|uniref:Acetoacetate decarboxylase n=1 Tax=Saccharothrix saharensis TaxID=571190 RepID=A0A543J8C1_9PSEU|nr:acetoacetate decarboxylase family protein [Saccharothrix saharensis]TQM79080.1 acetoacetate decarboxylase [Saccharothrix saharensis]
MVSYPPEPWELHGHACVSVWLVRTTALPPLPVRPVTVLGRAVVGTAFVDYRPPGMAYHEVLAAVLVRRGARFGVSITRIWVDSPASRAGGRELWGIPKDLAEFEWDGDLAASARDGHGPIAAVRARSPRVGVRLPVAGSTWQAFGDGVARTPLRATGRVTPVRVTWQVEPSGPLGWLLPHRPLLGLVVRDLWLRFGPRRR